MVVGRERGSMSRLPYLEALRAAQKRFPIFNTDRLCGKYNVQVLINRTVDCGT